VQTLMDGKTSKGGTSATLKRAARKWYQDMGMAGEVELRVVAAAGGDVLAVLDEDSRMLVGQFLQGRNTRDAGKALRRLVLFLEAKHHDNPGEPRETLLTVMPVTLTDFYRAEQSRNTPKSRERSWPLLQAFYGFLRDEGRIDAEVLAAANAGPPRR
jgi:hypothetical protein